jgi:hypothetical protein
MKLNKRHFKLVQKNEVTNSFIRNLIIESYSKQFRNTPDACTEHNMIMKHGEDLHYCTGLC